MRMVETGGDLYLAKEAVGSKCGGELRVEDFDGDFNFKWSMDSRSRRSLMSVEARRDDIVQLKQSKITRDQFLGKLKIVNTESSETLDPDLEVFSSMFGRLYRSDLSKTYYSEGNIYYERMKDVPILFLSGCYDSFADATIRNYVALGRLQKRRSA